MIPHRRFLLASLLVLVGVHGSASLEGQSAPRELRREASEQARLQLRQVLRLGSEDGANDAFGRVMGAAFGGSGRIYIADDRNFRVSVFEGDGRFVGHIGRQGNGPGEFARPWAVAADARDTVFVWDGTHRRISVFGPEMRFARSFGTPPEWLVTGMGVLPDGRLLVSAYASGSTRAVHVLDREGRVVRSIGPAIPATDLSGFEASLLGGSAVFDGGTIAFASKSPYEVTYFDIEGRTQGRCRAAGIVSDPASVVVSNAQGVGLQWSRYVHVGGIVSLGRGTHLVMIRDPVEDRTLLDVVGPGCTLLRRSSLPGPATFAARRGNRLLVIRNVDVPQVVVYEYSLERGDPPPPSRRRPR